MKRRAIAVALSLMLFLSFTVLTNAKQMVLEWNDDAAWHEAGHDAVSKLSEEEIGIGVKTVNFPDTSTYQTQMRMALTTSKAPELFDWWFGYRMKDLVDAGLVADVTRIWEKRIATGEYPASLMASFGFDGKAYALPKMINYYVMFYNTNVFDDLGLEVPTTWEEFLLICEKVKGAGLTPINAGAIGWPSLIWFEEIMIRTDPDVYVALMDGEIKYNDQRVLDAVGIWKDLIDRGYFSDPGMTGEALDKSFMQGQAAMTLQGDWYASSNLEKNDFHDFGVFVLPGVTDKGTKSIIVEGRPFLIGAKSPKRADAEKLADFFLSSDVQEVWADVLNINSANLLVPNDLRPVYLRQLSTDMAEGKYDTYTRYWEATPPEIVEPVVELLGKFMARPNQLKSVFDDATRIADAYWAQIR